MFLMIQEIGIMDRIQLTWIRRMLDQAVPIQVNWNLSIIPISNDLWTIFRSTDIAIDEN